MPAKLEAGETGQEQRRHRGCSMPVDSLLSQRVVDMCIKAPYKALGLRQSNAELCPDVLSSKIDDDRVADASV